MKRVPRNRTVADVPEKDTVHKHEPTTGSYRTYMYICMPLAHAHTVIRVQVGIANQRSSMHVRAL